MQGKKCLRGTDAYQNRNVAKLTHESHFHLTDAINKQNCWY